MAPKVKRRKGHSRVSRKHQVTIPVDALREAGLDAGDEVRVEVRRPGEVTLVQAVDPIDQFAGSMTGIWPDEWREELRADWP